MGKKSFVRPSMKNPLMKSKFELSKEHVDKVKVALTQCCENLFRKPVSTKQASEALAAKDPEFVHLKDKNLRKVRIKAMKKELRYPDGEKTDKEALRHIRIGLKQCLDLLNRKEVSAVLYDVDVNFDSVKCIFDKGTFPLIGIPQLSCFAKSLFGFPATCIAFHKQVSPRFAELVNLLQSFGSFKDQQLLEEPQAKKLKKTTEPLKETSDFGDDFIKFS